ncbi:MAG TPA: tripartite tricarboxylate transporter substrate binding protein [Xanthobacteraceae bacterium]|jgi:tripartite-type tricarboxylate transporter receptor subunit TctC
MREFTRRAVVAGLSALVAMPAFAEAAWPARPIKLMIGFPAGGPLDVVSRIIAQALSRRLGQQVVVEGRPGASGTIAAAQVAHAQPDGYTLLSIPATYAASAALFRKLPYRPIEDFSMIGTTTEFPYVLVTHFDHPIQTMADLVAAARSQKDPLTYGTSGAGSLQHLSIELFAIMANVKLQHIPYSGGAPAITELLGKRIDLVVDQPTALLNFVREGRFRALAVTGGKRFFALPDTPTISEGGFPTYAVAGWQGLVAPAGLPAPVLNRLHTELTGILAEPAIVEQLRRLGNDPSPTTPGAFRARLAADIETWSEVVAAANIEKI